MSWNFCPWCSHRLYMHDGYGCTQVEVVLQECTATDCTPGMVLSPEAAHSHEVPVRCDCKRTHPLLAAMSGEAIGG